MSNAAGARPHRPRRQMRDADDVSLTEILHLRDYWRTVRKRLWTLITAFCLIVGSVTVVTLLTPPVYEATASLQIDSQPQGNTNINAIGVYGTGQYQIDQEYFNTQHKKLRSRAQVRAVMDRENLYDDPSFKDLEPEEIVATLLDSVIIEPVPKTRLVWVYVRQQDAELARRICQAWAEVFVQRNLDEINKGAQDNLKWLAREVERAGSEVRAADAALLDFRRQNNSIALSSEEKGNLVMQQLEELSRKLAIAQSDAAERQAAYDAILRETRRQKDLHRLSLLVSSDLMHELREVYATLEGDRKAMLETYIASAPQMASINARIADAEAQIRQEVAAELGRRLAVLEEAHAREAELTQAISAVTAGALSEKEGEYNSLRLELESKRSIQKILTDRMQELDVTSQLKENNVRVVDVAEAKDDPVEPNYARNIGVAILAGLLAGVSLALFFDYMDTTIKTREEVEALGIPFLGIIPSVPGLAGDGWEVARERYLYSFNYPKSAFAEFCRNIRTNINFTAREDGKPPRRLLITSAGPREGKTTSSINLGLTFASTGMRVCLVDADLRRPSLHHAFGLANDQGFSSLMLGEASAEEVAQPTVQPGLFIIPSGPRPPNPAELLGSSVCRDALARLDQLFDLVIIDSPPVVAVTDAVVLSPEVDGVVMVVKSFKVARDLVMQAKRQLVDVDARLIGVILNDFDIQRKSYGYYYYYTYYGAEREDVGKTSRRAGRV